MGGGGGGVFLCYWDKGQQAGPGQHGKRTWLPQAACLSDHWGMMVTATAPPTVPAPCDSPNGALCSSSELQIMGPETGHLAFRCHSLTALMGTLRPREEKPSVGSKGQARVLLTREGPGWASLPSPGLFVLCGWEGRGLVEPGQWGGVRWGLGVGVKARIQGLPAPDLCLSGSRVAGVQRPGATPVTSEAGQIWASMGRAQRDPWPRQLLHQASACCAH